MRHEYVKTQFQRLETRKGMERAAIRTLLILTLLTYSSCSEVRSQNCGQSNKQWADNFALWQSKQITDYEMVFERFSNPTYTHVPFLIKVRNGENISLRPARENRGQELTDGYEAVSTVEALFNTVKAACERGDDITIEYDSELGIPSSIGFGNIAVGPDRRDGYKLESFVVIRIRSGFSTTKEE